MASLCQWQKFYACPCVQVTGEKTDLSKLCGKYVSVHSSRIPKGFFRFPLKIILRNKWTDILLSWLTWFLLFSLKIKSHVHQQQWELEHGEVKEMPVWQLQKTKNLWLSGSRWGHLSMWFAGCGRRKLGDGALRCPGKMLCIPALHSPSCTHF